MIDYDNNRRKYRANKYTFPIPSVATDAWTESDWITFIDNYGTWL